MPIKWQLDRTHIAKTFQSTTELNNLMRILDARQAAHEPGKGLRVYDETGRPTQVYSLAPCNEKACSSRA